MNPRSFAREPIALAIELFRDLIKLKPSRLARVESYGISFKLTAGVGCNLNLIRSFLETWEVVAKTRSNSSDFSLRLR